MNLPPSILDRLDGKTLNALSSALCDGVYADRDEPHKAMMMVCAVLTIAEGPAYLEQLYADMPARLETWSAEKDKLAPLLERIAAEHRRFLDDNKIKKPPEERGEKGDKFDDQFVAPYRDSFNGQKNGIDLRTEQREAAYYNSDPVVETARIMEVDSPFDRVIEAAKVMREGRRVNARALHYFKT